MALGTYLPFLGSRFELWLSNSEARTQLIQLSQETFKGWLKTKKGGGERVHTWTLLTLLTPDLSQLFFLL